MYRTWSIGFLHYQRPRGQVELLKADAYLVGEGDGIGHCERQREFAVGKSSQR
jgi:hypothetical protein